jgi:hypothetical protein
VEIKKVSPDGKFEATVVYLDGLTYGIQFVRLRDLRNPLIPFAHKIAISTLEDVKRLEWTSTNELHIYAEPEEMEGYTMDKVFETHEAECYGVKIGYSIKGPKTT